MISTFAYIFDQFSSPTPIHYVYVGLSGRLQISSTMSNTSYDIKDAPGYPNEPFGADIQKAEMEDRNEVFKTGQGQVDFRTVSWIRAGVIFLKSKSSELTCIMWKFL